MEHKANNHIDILLTVLTIMTALGLLVLGGRACFEEGRTRGFCAAVKLASPDTPCLPRIIEECGE